MRKDQSIPDLMNEYYNHNNSKDSNDTDLGVNLDSSGVLLLKPYDHSSSVEDDNTAFVSKTNKVLEYS
jgi:hypothetical protein